MTDDRSLERAARSWLEEGPSDAPPHAADAVLDRIAVTPQERDWHIPWRNDLMTQPARVVAIAAAFVVVIGVAIVVIRPMADPGGVGSIPSPTATASSPSPTVVPPTDLPSAPPTEVMAETFAIPFRMTWDVAIEPRFQAGAISIRFGSSSGGSHGGGGGGGMSVFHVEQVGIDPCQSDDLTADPLQTAEEFMAWLETIPDTTVGPVTATTLGGQPALERTLTVGSLDGCFDTGNLHSGIGPVGLGYFMGASEHDRWIALEVDGQLVAVVMYPANVPTLAVPAQRALDTLEFLP
jgi:hypothetical protein